MNRKDPCRVPTVAVTVMVAAILSCGPNGRSPAHPGAQSSSSGDGRKGKPQREELPLPAGREVSFERELARVAQIRGLKSKKPILGLEVSTQELLLHVTRAVELETPEKAIRGTEAMLVGIGVVPAGFDYKQTMLTLLSGKLAGLYDPHLGAMLIREGLNPPDREMTLLHELVHALQDQYYDVREVVEWSADDTDRSGALSALAEGDATSAMFDGMLGEGQTALSLPLDFIQEKMREDSDVPEGVPSIIYRSLKAPYIDGVTFVHALRARGGWDEVDRVWKKPPRTMEQVLHLDKYDSDEKPKSVAVPPPPSANAQLILHDIWGEQNLRLILEEWLPLADAAASSTGWGGDRIAAYQTERGNFVAWHIEADSEKDAERMFEGFTRGLTAAREQTDEGVTCGKVAAGRPLVGVFQSSRTLAIATSPRGTSDQGFEACSRAAGYILTHLVSQK